MVSCLRCHGCHGCVTADSDSAVTPKPPVQDLKAVVRVPTPGGVTGVTADCVLIACVGMGAHTRTPTHTYDECRNSRDTHDTPRLYWLNSGERAGNARIGVTAERVSSRDTTRATCDTPLTWRWLA